MFYLENISHISNFHYKFRNQIYVSLKSSRVLLYMSRKPFRAVWIEGIEMEITLLGINYALSI